MLKMIPVLSLLLGSQALAHVSLENPQAAAGSYYKAVVRVPHGCDATATTSLTVHLPKGFTTPKPMPKPGWDVAVETDNNGVATAVKFSGGNLPDAFYDEFVIRAKITAPANSILYFKVSQVCEKGQIDWFDIPAPGQDEHELAAPAASLKVTAGASGH
ncbi:YcnI family protein [Bdellovibrio bacteriovorus]|uniref:YncI copper-binding domain-containing protein n=1 Tax=Bdellovibrio bacteriovorus (strain ATCC 15356 / DSM 50701 / NCIMB 9529 / HD100) TaxID=264462 RepID=Q6MLE6_BDEBA|nr:hypothetical protein Bd2065 [Bdellovibrio bacteriovorus HD100]